MDKLGEEIAYDINKLESRIKTSLSTKPNSVSNKENTTPKVNDNYVSIEDFKILENKVRDSTKSSSRLKENFSKLNRHVSDVSGKVGVAIKSVTKIRDSMRQSRSVSRSADKKKKSDYQKLGDRLNHNARVSGRVLRRQGRTIKDVIWKLRDMEE